MVLFKLEAKSESSHSKYLGPSKWDFKTANFFILLFYALKFDLANWSYNLAKLLSEFFCIHLVEF